MSKIGNLLKGLAIFCGAAATAGALAVPTLTNTVIRVEASNANGSGFHEFTLGDGSYPDADSFELNMVGPVTIYDTGNPLVEIARIGDVAFSAYDFSDFKQMSLAYVAYSLDGETTFRISSGLFSFNPLGSVDATSSGAFGVTDTTEPGNGALFTANGPGGNAYYTYTNGLTPAPAGNLFVGLGSNIVAPAAGTNGSGALFHNALVAGSVGSMSQDFLFKVSDGDYSSASMTFAITPEPASLLLIGLAALTIRRR